MQINWLNKKQAAKYAGISRDTLDAWILDGLYCRKIGNRYFLRADKIDEWIDKGGQPESVADIVDQLFRGV